MRDFLREEFRKTLTEKDVKLDLTRKEAFDNLNKLIADFKHLSTKEEVENLDKIKAVTKWAKFEFGRDIKKP